MIQLLLAVFYLSFISLGLPDALLGSAWPSMYPALGVPISYAGIISMLIAGSTIVSSLLCDRLVRRLGTGMLTAGSVGMTAASLFGFSVSGQYWQLCLWAIPYGLGAGSVDAALNNFVALHYKARHMSWLHCFWGLGATIGPYIMGACLTRQLPWNTGYRIIAIIQVCLTALLIFTIPLWKQHAASSQTDAVKSDSPGIKTLIALPGAGKILLAFFCYCSLEMISGLWGSSYMVIKKGISPEQAASYASLFYLGITAGHFVSGFLTIRLNSSQMIRIGQALAFSGILMLLFFSHTYAVCAGFLLIGTGCAPIYPCLLHQTPERFGINVSQAMMGLQMACAYVGTTVSPLLAGFMTEHISVTLYPFLLLFFIIVMTLSIESCNRSKHMVIH